MRERVDALYHSDSRHVLATLIRLLGDFDLAEDALHDAFTAAVEQWPSRGVPANPRAWLVSTGRFKAIDCTRRRARFDASLTEIAEQLEAGTRAEAAKERADAVDFVRYGGVLMTITDAFIAELTQETETTRRVLERVPEDRLSWKPHPKSMSLGQLALHIAVLPRGIAELLSAPVAEVPTVPRPEATSLRQILLVLEKSAGIARAKLSAWGDAGLWAEWKMTRGTETILEVPRDVMVRSLLLNHWYHHRGQLTVYLRLLGVPLPPVYGATADEAFPV